MKFFIQENTETSKNDKIINDIISNYPYDKNILLFGEVQSGKTSVVTKIIDKLFTEDKVDYIFYVTGNTNPLKKQNFDRLYQILKPKGYELVDTDDKFYTQRKNREVDKNKVVFTAIKQQLILFKEYIENNFKDKKLLIIDDEADDYSNSESNAKIMNELLSKNIGLISCTATPFTNLKVNEGIYDAFYKMDPWEGYTGRKDFFENMVAIDDKYNEVNYITLLEFVKTIYENPHIQNAQLLYNTDRQTKIHRNDKEMIIELIEEIIAFKDRAKTIYENITKKEIDIEKSVEVLKDIKSKGNICVLNRKTDENFLNEGIEIIFGGIMLSRGITFENLLVEVYRNMGNKITAHTLMQRSRWCGYRGDTKDLIKIFAEEKTITALKEINTLYDMTLEHDLKSSEKYEEKVKLLQKTFTRINV